jgi:myo-inositol 2-dehydrogenase/D-chiro-inositol 1-dehydrogenase
VIGQDLRLGLVGCGRLAERGYVPAFRRARGVRLAAVADLVAERCQRVAAGVPAFTSAEEMLGAGNLDAVVLATPAAAHLDDARLVAGAGLSALVEKPPAQTLADTRALARLEPAPVLGFNRRFEPHIERLRALAGSDPAIELELELCTRPESWDAYDVRDDALLNLGPHLVDLARWLTGAEVERVCGSVDDDRAVLELGLRSAARATLTCIGNRAYRERVVVRSRDRRVGTWGRRGGAVAAARGFFTGSSHPLVGSLAGQLEAFARVVGGQRDRRLATAADGVAVMEVLDAARESAALGGVWLELRRDAD